MGVTMEKSLRALAAMLPLTVVVPVAAQNTQQPAQTSTQSSAPNAQSGWSHAESSYYPNEDGFEYHPFRFHIDGGGTITQRDNATLLDNGWNAGAGLSWFPGSHLPLGIRVDGTYMQFNARNQLLNQASAHYGTQVDEGTIKMWGGDADLELDFHFSPRVRGYLVAGVGWYRVQTTYRQLQLTSALFCDWWYGCTPGYATNHQIIARTTTDWQPSRNAGVGLEWALGGRTSFFIDARYMRLNPKDSHSDFLPIRAGLRF
jgi:opacity protein-like surface antigen